MYCDNRSEFYVATLNQVLIGDTLDHSAVSGGERDRSRRPWHLVVIARARLMRSGCRDRLICNDQVSSCKSCRLSFRFCQEELRTVWRYG
jgi:hypothetical protein